jgi:hypothetical protein
MPTSIFRNGPEVLSRFDTDSKGVSINDQLTMLKGRPRLFADWILEHKSMVRRFLVPSRCDFGLCSLLYLGFQPRLELAVAMQLGNAMTMSDALRILVDPA